MPRTHREKIQTSIILPVELRRAAREYQARHELGLGALVRVALREFFDRHANTTKPTTAGANPLL